MVANASHNVKVFKVVDINAKRVSEPQPAPNHICKPYQRVGKNLAVRISVVVGIKIVIRHPEIMKSLKHGFVPARFEEIYDWATLGLPLRSDTAPF